MNEFRRNISYISVCNRLMAEKIIPLSVENYNKGKFKQDYFIFEEREYYRNIFVNALSKSISEEFVQGIKIERAYRNNLHVISLTVPNNDEIGEAVIIGVIIDKDKNKATAYCMEKSSKAYMICQWADGVHYNYGATVNKSSFFSTILTLAEEDFNEKDSSPAEELNVQSTVPPSKDYNYSKRGKNSIKSDWKKYLIGGLISVIVIVLLIFIFWSKIVNGIQSRSDSNAEEPLTKTGDFHEDQERTEKDYDEEESSNEYLDMDDYDEWAGETFVFHPEDGSIRTTSGKIISEESTPAAQNNTYSNNQTSTSNNHTSTKHSESLDNDRYAGVEITHYLNGEYPYSDFFGKGSFDSKSLSTLEISNKSALDAVVLLCDANDNVIRNVFVKNNSNYVVKQIPACRCIIKIMYGRDWYKDKDNGSNFPKGGFTKDVSYTISKWSDAFDFIPHYVENGIDYPTYEVTLHAVANGNFQTKASNKNEFFNSK